MYKYTKKYFSDATDRPIKTQRGASHLQFAA